MGDARQRGAEAVVAQQEAGRLVGARHGGSAEVTGRAPRVQVPVPRARVNERRVEAPRLRARENESRRPCVDFAF